MVEPAGGSNFCRSGTMCRLAIDIIRVKKSKKSQPKLLMYEVIVDQILWAVCGRVGGVISIGETGRHHVCLDVMPLSTGFLPVPHIKLAKYIPEEKGDQPAAAKPIPAGDKSSSQETQPSGGGGNQKAAKVTYFSKNEVYVASRARQVHVLPAVTTSAFDVRPAG